MISAVLKALHETLGPFSSPTWEDFLLGHAPFLLR